MIISDVGPMTAMVDYARETENLTEMNDNRNGGKWELDVSELCASGFGRTPGETKSRPLISLKKMIFGDYEFRKHPFCALITLH